MGVVMYLLPGIGLRTDPVRPEACVSGGHAAHAGHLAQVLGQLEPQFAHL